MPGLSPRLHLPFSQWPVMDQRLWVSATTANDDPFGDAPGTRLAQATREKYRFGWRRFLGFLAINDAEALGVYPAQRLTLERVRCYVSHLSETNRPQSVATQVDGLYQAARMLMPHEDWTWLRSVKTRLQATAPTHGRPRPVITSLALVDLGQELMDASKRRTGVSLRMIDAIRYRDGLMIALVGFHPLRRKNLAALEIGRHLVRQGDRWLLLLPRAEVKKKSCSIEFEIPELLAPYLAYYLDVIRPRILRDSTSPALWVSPGGAALNYSAIWPIFARHTAARLGIHIAPHDGRDAGATTWAVMAPDQIGVARDLLGHSDLRTTTRHYNRARGIEASRAYTRLIQGMRRRQCRTRTSRRDAWRG
jgi:integrase